MKVLVLMSTYNGEIYLKEQILSIINQDFDNLSILVRDDGSTDSTIRILESFKKEYGNIDYYKGDMNVGPAQSFLQLIKKAPLENDYFFFSDQDDFWMPDKVHKAINSMQGCSSAAMYYSATELVDQNLQHIGYNFRQPRFSNSIVYSFLRGSLISGCTICINKQLFTMLKKYSPTEVSMHDTWIHYLCLSIGGKIFSDSSAHIRYRQHSTNVLGIHEMTIFEKYKKNFVTNRKPRRMAIQLVDNYSNELSKEACVFLNSFICYDQSFRKKIKFAYIALKGVGVKDKIYVLLKILLAKY